MIRIFIAMLALSVASALVGQTQAAGRDVIETIDARELTGRLVSATDKTITIRVDSKDRSLPADDVAGITLRDAEDVMVLAGQVVIVTTAGDKLAATKLRLADGYFEFVNPLLGQTRLAIQQASIIYLPSPGQSARDVAHKCNQMKFTPGVRDILVVEKSTALLSVRGVLSSILPAEGGEGAESGDKVSFTYKRKSRKLSLRTVRAIMLAKSARKPKRIIGKLIGRSGTELNFSALTLDDKTFAITLPAIGERKIRRKSVASIKFKGDRVVELSSLTPIKVKEYGFFDTTFPHRINRSISGRAIRLVGKTYASGIGLHSVCELTYKLDGQYDQLVAIVGIDDAVRPGGDAELSITGDGKALMEPMRLTGKDKPGVIRIKVAGVKELVILVGFGKDDLDIADHVDLAGARLIKPRK